MFLMLTLIVGALIASLVANRLLLGEKDSRESMSDAEGLSITDIAGIVPTMSVLLLAFIMVATFDSWKTANSGASEEAITVLSMTRAARFLPSEHGAEIARSMLCYSRAVEHQEWPAMSDQQASNVPEYWSDATSRAIQDARKTGGDAALDLITIDRDLRERRQVRLTQATPAVPTPMTVLMVVSVVLSVFYLGMLTHATVRTPVQLAALLGSTMLLTGALLLIKEMDSPFSGMTRIQPSAIHQVQDDIVSELAEYTTRQPAPCSKKGLPSVDGSFEPATEAIA